MNALPRDRARTLAAASFLAGLVLFGAMMVLLALLASGAQTFELQPQGPVVQNGSAYLPFVVPQWDVRAGRIEGAYAFQGGAGDVLLLRCDQVFALERGETLDPSGVGRLESAVSGEVSYDPHDLMWHPLPPFPAEPRFPRHAVFMCGPPTLALRWSAPDEAAARQTMPTASFTLRETPLDEGPIAVPLGLAALGVALTATGGIAWTRGRREAALPAAHEDESTAETLLLVTDRALAWLERTRRYLVLGGVLGVFLWYPVLLSWAWQAGRRASADGDIALVLAAGVLAFLGVLTALWTREFLRLDRELASWRERLARLRRREADLMEELERA